MTTGSANSFAAARIRLHAILFALVISLFFAGRCMSALAQDRADFPVNTQHLVYHDVKTDASGAIVRGTATGRQLPMITMSACFGSSGTR